MLIRRAAGHASAVIERGPLKLDTARKEVRLDDNRVDLTAFEYRVLEYLMVNAARRGVQVGVDGPTCTSRTSNATAMSSRCSCDACGASSIPTTRSVRSAPCAAKAIGWPWGRMATNSCEGASPSRSPDHARGRPPALPDRARGKPRTRRGRPRAHLPGRQASGRGCSAWACRPRLLAITTVVLACCLGVVALLLDESYQQAVLRGAEDQLRPWPTACSVPRWSAATTWRSPNSGNIASANRTPASMRTSTRRARA